MQRRTFLATTSATAGLGLLAACAPGSGTDPSGQSTGPAAADVETDPSALGDVTITVWDQEVRGAQNDAIIALIEAFQEAYPNITVERLAQSYDDLLKQTGLALSGNDVPDVLQVNNARADMGAYVAAGQLTDLTGYVEAYGWEDRIPATVLEKSRYSADGVTFGDGPLWGLPQSGEVVGIFYSAKKLEALGLEAPKTWDELFALVTAATEAGEQPIVLGNLDDYPATHVFGPLQANFVAAEEIVKLGMGNAGAEWTTEGSLAAMTQIGEWAKDGVFGSSPNGLAYDTAWADFTKGTGVMLIAGNWLGPDMAAAMGDDLHFMAPPPGLEGQIATTGGPGIPYSIPAAAKNRDAAAAYIDFITTEDAMKIVAEKGGLPVVGAAELAPESGINAEIFGAFDSVSTTGTLLPYLGYATPTFGDTAADALQGVIGGDLSPQEALEMMQEDYAAFTEGS